MPQPTSTRQTKIKIPGKLSSSRKASPTRAGANVPKLFRPMTLRNTHTIKAATGSNNKNSTKRSSGGGRVSSEIDRKSRRTEDASDRFGPSSESLGSARKA